METNELITALRRMKVETGSLICFGCGHEHSCSTRGCALIRAAADRLEGGETIKSGTAKMTREELQQWFAEWLEDYYDELHTEDDLTPEVAESVLVALRTPTREMVERMAGEWVQDVYKGPAVFHCSFCGKNFEIHSHEYTKYKFCPNCGAPMTDEAVDMMLERVRNIWVSE